MRRSFFLKKKSSIEKIQYSLQYVPDFADLQLFHFFALTVFLLFFTERTVYMIFSSNMSFINIENEY